MFYPDHVRSAVLFDTTKPTQVTVKITGTSKLCVYLQLAWLDLWKSCKGGQLLYHGQYLLNDEKFFFVKDVNKQIMQLQLYIAIRPSLKNH